MFWTFNDLNDLHAGVGFAIGFAVGGLTVPVLIYGLIRLTFYFWE